MKVESIKIKNFKAIQEEKLDIKGNNVYLLGPNGSGKTSFADSIFKILTGKDLPSKLVKDGENNGQVEINLGEIIVKATFNAKNERVNLTVETPDGMTYKSPRTMLDEKVGIVDFDINTFFNLSPKKQVDFIKNLVGIDFTDLDDEYKKHFDERTFINRRVKELEAQQIPFEKNIVEEIDITQLQCKIQKANEKNLEIQGVKQRTEERQRRILELEAELTDLKTKNSQAVEWLKTNTEIDLTELNSEFNKAIEYNKQVENTRRALKLRNELHEAIKLQEDLNINLQSIEETKRKVISESKMPVEGLTFDDNQLYLNGLPFERSQINTAQQIITGLQINLALLKDVKIARFDGSLLDNKNIQEVEKWAKENDLQLFVEFVERNGEGLKIEIKE